MATEWLMKGEYIKNCGCAPGCPCDFWAPPTHHKCEGMIAMRIVKGNFGGTSLDGLTWAGVAHWPGPLHEGKGTLQPYISDKANEEQRNALLTILSGKAGNAWFEVVASTIATVHPPKFAPIEFDFNLAKRQARVRIPGELETVTEPIKNLVTGEEHRVLVDMPKGMEYFHPEVATAKVPQSTGELPVNSTPRHSSLASAEQPHKGVVA